MRTEESMTKDQLAQQLIVLFRNVGIVPPSELVTGLEDCLLLAQRLQLIAKREERT